MSVTLRLSAAVWVALLAGPAAAEPFNVQQAIAQLDAHAAELTQTSGIPGVAVAVVHGGQVVYAKGFGERVTGGGEPVDADTVLQLASMSKPIGATVVAGVVGEGLAAWDAPIRRYDPGFTLDDAYPPRWAPSRRGRRARSCC